MSPLLQVLVFSCALTAALAFPVFPGVAAVYLEAKLRPCVKRQEQAEAN